MKPRRSRNPKTPVARPGKIRIGAGRWRGSLVRVPELTGLRPTSSRFRGTLFNWLVADLPGARCLDLYAGTGILGLEALSRGAAHCTFIDNSALAVAAMQENLDRFEAKSSAWLVRKDDALHFLDDLGAHGEWPFDLVFVDPPFEQGLLDQTLARLAHCRSKRPFLLYFEAERMWEPCFPDGFSLLRSGEGGAVRYGLSIWKGALDHA